MLGLRPESLELAAEGIPARVEVVEELGADAYVFCVAEVGGEEVKLVARSERAHVAAPAASASTCGRGRTRRTSSTPTPGTGCPADGR